MLPEGEGYVSLVPGVPTARIFLARLHAELGRNAEAQAQLACVDVNTMTVLPRDDHWLFLLGVRAELCARLEEREPAEALLELASPYAQQGMILGWVLVCSGSLARPLGSIAALLGRWDLAEPLFLSALEYADALRSPMLRAWTELEQARAWIRHPRAA